MKPFSDLGNSRRGAYLGEKVMYSLLDMWSLRPAGIVKVVMYSRQWDINLEPKKEICSKDTDLGTN